MITIDLHNDVEFIKFSGGEIHLKEIKDYIDFSYSQLVQIVSRIQCSDDLMKLLLLTDSIRRNYKKDISVVIPYLPYARQDRVSNKHDSLSIKVFCDIINSQNYKSVIVLDPHSDVSSALLNNISILPQEQIFNIENINEFVVLSPDAGAFKKINKVANKSGYTGEIIICEKVRDTNTGNITGTKINTDNLKDKKVLIIDDIIDAGGTYLGISKEAKKLGATKVVLCVTHSIFSKGLDVVFEHIDRIITTDSFIFNDFNNKEFIRKYDLEILPITNYLKGE